uniref:ZP domain-containing protein n=1 Tax=Parascaris univalens TaxID=6257 RepID=A0A915BA94_PARUN
MAFRSSVLLLMAIARFTIAQKLIRGWFSQSVRCHSDRMEVKFEFEEPFKGVVFAEKHYEERACRWLGNSTLSLAIAIPTPTTTSNTSCGVALEQSTGELSTTLIVSPLAGILVSGVTNMQVRCLYIANDITVTISSFQVVSSDRDAGVVTGSGGTPTLLMQILDGHGIDGHVLTQASVGQPLTLDLVLKNTAIYDFYVYSCFAHDGSNSRDASVQIIDANGCGVHLARAIDAPVYVSQPHGDGSKHVYIHMYGFQFTSSQLVHFECQARPCVRLCKRKQCDEKKDAAAHAKDKVARKRREEEDNDVAQLRLQTVLQMKPQPPEYAQMSSEMDATCPSALSLFESAVIIGLAATGGLALAYVLFLCKRKRDRNANPAYSEGSSITSRTYSEPNYTVTSVWHSSKY